MKNGVLKTIKVVIAVCDTPYPYSGHVYPKKVLKEAVNAEYTQRQIKYKTLFGDIENEDNFGKSEVDVNSIAFSATKLYFYKNLLKAQLDVLDTEGGKQLLQHIAHSTDDSKYHFTLVGSANYTNDVCTHLELDKITYVK